jgi:phospholipase/lecithinase/hemolysin
MHAQSLVLALLTATAFAGPSINSSLPQQRKHPALGWDHPLKTLLAFGDSYTDESRLSYFVSHAGLAPPVGWIGPDNPVTASGGHSWARYVSYYTGATLYNYAVSGAVCSNLITPRYLDAINASFPSVREYEIPAFRADYTSGSLGVEWESTVVAVWIGTNDLGGGGFLGHQQKPGKTTVDYVRCVFEQLWEMYKLGARRFVLLNVAPLELAPLYSADGTPGPDKFWEEKGNDTRSIAENMRLQVAAVNEMFLLRGELGIKGARVAVLDTNALLRDVYYRPEMYLNGTVPLNVTGYNVQCGGDGNCWVYRGDDRDAFMWYDELHPSEQVGRVLAREFVETVKGRGKWATYW